LWVLPPAAILFTVHSLFADNLGFRYLLPMLPFLYVGGGYALSRLPRPAAGLLCLWIAVNCAGIYPDHLSYFNEGACLLRDPARLGFAAGSACGPEWLDDSNVDWGQGAKQLADWLHGRRVRVAWFGPFPARAYGIQAEDLRELPQTPSPGLYAVSAHLVACAPVEWLRTMRRGAIVGHAVYVYDVK
jgi:hypothetical protein